MSEDKNRMIDCLQKVRSGACAKKYRDEAYDELCDMIEELSENSVKRNKPNTSITISADAITGAVTCTIRSE